MGKRAARHADRERKRAVRRAAPVKRVVRVVAEHGRKLVRSNPTFAAACQLSRTEVGWDDRWHEVEELDWAIDRLYLLLIRKAGTMTHEMRETVVAMLQGWRARRNDLVLANQSIPSYSLTSYQPQETRDNLKPRTGSFEAWARS